jgi:hypothetical protein
MAFHAGKQIWTISRVSKLLADPSNLFVSDLRQFAELFKNHSELISTHARHSALSKDACRDSLRGLLKKQVSGLVAESIVHGFEVIKIDKQERAIAMIAHLGSLQHRVEGSPVGEMRERVVEGEIFNHPQRLLHVGDVTGYDHDTLNTVDLNQ